HTRFSRDWSSDVCSSDLGFGQSHRRRVAMGPADPGGADEGGYRRNGRQHEQGVDARMTALFLAAYFLPFAVWTGEQPPDMIDHDLHLLGMAGRLPWLPASVRPCVAV